jgi:hypothetical protein
MNRPGGYRDLGSARLGTIGEGHWHAAKGEFSYIEDDLDDLSYNSTDLELTAATGRHHWSGRRRP